PPSGPVKEKGPPSRATLDPSCLGKTLDYWPVLVAALVVSAAALEAELLASDAADIAVFAAAEASAALLSADAAGLLQAASESAPTAAPATRSERTKVEVMIAWSPWVRLTASPHTIAAPRNMPRSVKNASGEFTVP
ncbi:MAG TPA: hypothetical protein VGG68_08065, partial [Caulobacteraceae bacterium]